MYLFIRTNKHLLSKINNCSEALAHQRLTSRILAARNMQLEQKLTKIPITDELIEHSRKVLETSELSYATYSDDVLLFSPIEQQQLVDRCVNDSDVSRLAACATPISVLSDDEYFDVDS